MTLKIKKLQDDIAAAKKGLEDVYIMNRDWNDNIRDEFMNEFNGALAGFMEEYDLEPFFIFHYNYLSSNGSYLHYKTIRDILHFTDIILFSKVEYYSFKDLDELENILKPIFDIFIKARNNTYFSDMAEFSTGELCFTREELYTIYWKVIDNSSLST